MSCGARRPHHHRVGTVHAAQSVRETIRRAPRPEPSRRRRALQSPRADRRQRRPCRLRRGGRAGRVGRRHRGLTGWGIDGQHRHVDPPGEFQCHRLRFPREEVYGHRDVFPGRFSGRHRRHCFRFVLPPLPLSPSLLSLPSFKQESRSKEQNLQILTPLFCVLVQARSNQPR